MRRLVERVAEHVLAVENGAEERAAAAVGRVDQLEVGVDRARVELDRLLRLQRHVALEHHLAPGAAERVGQPGDALRRRIGQVGRQRADAVLGDVAQDRRAAGSGCGGRSSARSTTPWARPAPCWSRRSRRRARSARSRSRRSARRSRAARRAARTRRRATVSANASHSPAWRSTAGSAASRARSRSRSRTPSAISPISTKTAAMKSGASAASMPGSAYSIRSSARLSMSNAACTMMPPFPAASGRSADLNPTSRQGLIESGAPAAPGMNARRAGEWRDDAQRPISHNGDRGVSGVGCYAAAPGAIRACGWRTVSRCGCRRNRRIRRARAPLRRRGGRGGARPRQRPPGGAPGARAFPAGQHLEAAAGDDRASTGRVGCALARPAGALHRCRPRKLQPDRARAPARRPAGPARSLPPDHRRERQHRRRPARAAGRRAGRCRRLPAPDRRRRRAHRPPRARAALGARGATIRTTAARRKR